jgi:hypothetical protein
MFVREQNVGQPPYRYLEDNRRSCENSEESRQKSLCAKALGKHVPENRLNYEQSVEMTGLNACEGMRWLLALDFFHRFLKFRAA